MAGGGGGGGTGGVNPRAKAPGPASPGRVISARGRRAARGAGRQVVKVTGFVGAAWPEAGDTAFLDAK